MKLITLALLMVQLGFGQGAPSKPAEKMNLVDRLNQMTPEQRRRVLDRMAPERRKLLEERITKLNNIAPEVKERVRKDYEFFQQLPPEKQDVARHILRDISALPLERRPLVRGAIANLRRQPADVQESRMNSRAFQQRFSESERRMIRDALDTLPPVEPPPTQND